MRLVSAGSWCADDYWTGQCTLCPGFWYQNCRSGYQEHTERGCGFWSAGCEINCRNGQHSYNDGCGCGAGTACLNVDCAVSSWSAYGACTSTCGGGTQTRSRTVTRNQAYNGAACPSLSESRACNTSPCPVDCAVSGFGAWSACSETCGDGTQTRERSVTQDPMYNGTACPALVETRSCKDRDCPVHCDVSEWGAYSECSETCGTGSKTRTRDMITAPQHGGDECPALEETIACKLVDCPVDCVVSEWGAFESCTETCGEGTKTRLRQIITDPLHGGAECPADLTETVPCNERECPVDCVVSEFGEWGECSVSCDPGQQTRSRTITQESLHGGAACPDLTESRDCPEQLACDCTTQARYEARCAWPRLSGDRGACVQKYGCAYDNDACGPIVVPAGARKAAKIKCKKLEKSVCACFSGCRLKTKRGKTKCKGSHKIFPQE